MDQCKHCEARGDQVWCSSLPCTHHETWYATELRKELADRQGSMDSFRADYLKNESVLKTIHDSLRGREPLDTDPTTQTIQEVRALYSRVMKLEDELSGQKCDTDFWKDLAKKNEAATEKVKDALNKAVQKYQIEEHKVSQMKRESAEAFADLLIEEGVLLDYGSNIGREPPEDALKRFRTTLAEKERDNDPK